MPEDKIIENATLPKKRVSPFEVEPIDEVNEPKKIEKKTKTSTTSKKDFQPVHISHTIPTHILMVLSASNTQSVS